MNFLCQIRNFTCIQKNCQRTTYFHPYYWTIGEVLNVILLRIRDGQTWTHGTQLSNKNT